MSGRVAFTAEFWGDSAVICRATDDQPGPAVVQEFGEFESWTQAQTFAQHLNQGLDLPIPEVLQILTSSILSADPLFRNFDSLEASPAAPVVNPNHSAVQLEFTLTELDLALTFCRILNSRASIQNERLLRNARNALFNALHFLFHSELPDFDLLLVRAKSTNYAGSSSNLLLLPRIRGI